MDEILSADERLRLLREIDRFSPWYSLDDKRVCGICERVFWGREIRFQEQAQTGYALRCPTENCPAVFSHWLVWSNREALTAPSPDLVLNPERGEFRFF